MSAAEEDETALFNGTDCDQAREVEIRGDQNGVFFPGGFQDLPVGKPAPAPLEDVGRCVAFRSN